MANQGHDRREVLEMLAMAGIASQFSGFSKWICASQHATDHAASASEQPRPARYDPQFFTPDEYTLVDQLAEMIIPKDESPGAREAGVSEFIDFMAASDPTIQQPFRDGLHWLDDQARKEKGTDFAELAPDQKATLLETVAYRDRYVPGQRGGQEFFALFRRYAVMAYYTSRIGLKELDFPGLRMYTQSPACPHTGDPEHRHLPPPRY
ncbi:MAG: gluconate 2-dehydrogenase subunit 3 family protein [Bryobacteraceae bacterium]